MARSSHGPRQATAWAAAQKPRSMPRVVRLGRPANDNFRRPGLLMRLCIVGLTGALAALALANWRFL